MFTGLVEETGRIAQVTPGAPTRLVIACSFAGELALGESVAVLGCCLTVVAREAGTFAVELGPETLKRTVFGALGPGDGVHLERSLRPTDCLGGHFVTGHVDGLGGLRAVRPSGGSAYWTIGAPLDLMPMIAAQGSVCVDGVSLTVVSAGADAFEVMLIPHTLAVTRFGGLAVGAQMHLEVDLLARYVRRLLSFGS